MDGSVTHLQERCQYCWDNPPPFLEQYIKEVEAAEFEATAFVGIGLAIAIPPTIVEASEAVAQEMLGLIIAKILPAAPLVTLEP